MNENANVQMQAADPSPATAEEVDRLRALESQLKEYQRLQEQAVERKEQERLTALAEAGKVQEALALQREAWERKHAEAVGRYTALEKQVFEERKAAAIAEALQGRPFTGETPEQRQAAAAMVRRLLQDEFETVRSADGSLAVRDRETGRPAAEALRERLDSSRFALFFAPTSRGGSGVGAAARPAPDATSLRPGSLEAIASQWRDRQAQYGSFGLHPVARP